MKKNKYPTIPNIH